jgi:hypothetical protein
VNAPILPDPAAASDISRAWRYRVTTEVPSEQG